MANVILSKMASFWTSKISTRYTKMESQGQHEATPAQGRSSFEHFLNGEETDKLAQWPNFAVEDEYGDQHDRHSIRSVGADTAEMFFPHRVAGKHNSKPGLRLMRMATRFPIRDLSWIVGISFTIGSAVFVANGFFLLLPMIDPTTDFGAEGPYLTPASSALGTLIFLIGSWLALLEALNLKRGMSVTEGLEVEMTLSTELLKPGSKEDEPLTPHQWHTQSDTSSQSSTTPIQHLKNIPSDFASDPDDSQPTLALLGSPTFIYLPNAHQFHTTYAHDLYFFASAIQLVGATIFTFATITSLPGVIDFTNKTLVSLTNYLPASLGGLLFLIAALLQMLNVQEKWWKPKLDAIEWHIGGWNALGSVGFMLAGALPWLEWDFQATLADFWGSWAFFVGSVLQWYCAMGSYV